jgi:hypothetical protein
MHVSTRLTPDAFPQNLILGTLRKPVQNLRIFVKIGQKYRKHDTEDRSTLFCVAGHIHSPCRHCCATLNSLIWLAVTGRSTIHTECIATFPLQQCLRERATLLLYIRYLCCEFWRNWVRLCAPSRKVTGSIPDGVIVIFYWHNPSGRTMAMGLTQPLIEMSTRNTSWRVKAAGAYGWQPYHLHVPTVLNSGSLNLLEPSGSVQACNWIVLPLPYVVNFTCC